MKHLYSFVCPICLGKADSLRRTNTCACAALCASISINHVALCTLYAIILINLKLLELLILTFDEGKGTTFFE